MEDMLIKAQVREKTGKGSARKIRSQGFVPAVLYGHGIDPVHLAISEKDIRKIVANEAKLLTIEIEGRKSKEKVIVKDLDIDPVRDSFLHIDFQRIRMDEKISASVPIVVSGEEVSVGLKAGGVLQHGIREIEVECLPGDLPSHIEVDISKMEIGDAIRVEDLNVPDGVTVVSPGEELVLTIVPPAVYVEPEAEEEVEAAEVPTVAESQAEEER